jgi:spermidine/putrescine transport system permease protein
VGALRERALAWLYTRPEARAWALMAPGGFWLLAFFLVPLLIMFVYSLMPRGIYGGVEPGFTLDHYARFFDPLYLQVLQRTFTWSIACTVI